MEGRLQDTSKLFAQSQCPIQKVRFSSKLGTTHREKDSRVTLQMMWPTSASGEGA